MLKRCSKCKKYLSRTKFDQNCTAADGLYQYCIACTRSWHAAFRDRNRSKYNKAARKRYTVIRDALKVLMKYIKENLPCKNCRKWYVKECMEFDHYELARHQKNNMRHTLNANYTFQGFINELVKVRVLCANCHSLRTAQQRGIGWNLAKEK